jgi:hypothetical protein
MNDERSKFKVQTEETVINLLKFNTMNRKKLIKLKAFNIAIAILCIGVLFFVSCREDEVNRTHDPSQLLVATSFMPDSGRISEMVLLDGDNFGTDTSKINVYFNSRKAMALSSTGTRILALVPRLPGDTCILTVEVDGKRVTYPGFFRYKIEATASTFVGNGLGACGYQPEIFSTLDDSQFRAVYMASHNFDIYVTTECSYLLKLNEKENTVIPLAAPSHGMSARFKPNVHPVTGEIMLGGEGAQNWNQFLILDPNEGWAPQRYHIKEWITNDYPMPTPEKCTDTHQLVYCPFDEHLYTHYTEGQLVKINPKTWVAEIIYMIVAESNHLAFNTLRPYELWMPFQTGKLYCSFVRLDIRNPEGTYKQMNQAMAGHRDGRLEQALFNNIRQTRFDSQGNLFAVDSGNSCVRKIDTETLMVETVLGIPGLHGFANGKREDALFNKPHGMAIDPDDILYIGDWLNNRVRRIAVE